MVVPVVRPYSSGVQERSSAAAGPSAAPAAGTGDSPGLATERDLSVGPTRTELMDTLLRTAPVGVALWDRDLRYVLINARLAQANGMSADSHIGRTTAQVVPELAAAIDPVLRQVLQTGEPVLGVEMQGGQPASHWSTSWFPVLAGDGSVDAVAVIATDVADLVEAREALRVGERVQRGLSQASRHAEAQAREAGQRLEILASVTAAVAGSGDDGEAVRRLVQTVTGPVADAVMVHLVDDSALVLAAEATVPGLPLLPHRSEAHPGTHPLMVALERERPMLLDLRAGGIPASEGGAAWMQEFAAHSAVFAPLRRGGALLGVLTLIAVGDRPPYDDSDLLLVEELAGRAADALAHVQSWQRSRETALTLQRSLLPSRVPDSGELEVAVRYSPGVADTEVGGDWYDVIELGAGRLGIVIGDVMGRGLHAAAVMGQLRTAVRTCARLDLRPAEVISTLDSLVADLGEGQIATCLYAVFDPITRDLVLASAGHLPPVLRSVSGGAEVVTVEVGAPLGVGDTARESRLALPPGCVLALYTDGLVETRDRDIDAGVLALAKAMVHGPAGLEALADAVLRELAHAQGHDDDVALMLLQVPLDVDSRSSTVVLEVPRERARLGELRERASTVLLRWALVQDVVDRAVLLLSELVTNAVVHGSGRAELRLRLTRDRLVVEVCDDGCQMPRRRSARDDDEGGRGLQLVSALATRWGARQHDDGKVVWAEFDLARPVTRRS